MKPDRISQTAAFIAIKFYGLTRMEPYRSWFDGEIVRFYEQLTESLQPPLNRYHSLLKKSWIRKFFTFSEELLLPGDLMHVILRKYFIGRHVEELVDKGYEQLIVLGAGFDHLAVIHSQRGTASFEIDTPHMADLKRAFILNQGYQNPSLKISKAFFPEISMATMLQNTIPADPQKKTAVVAEGFFDYLTSKNMAEILDDLATFFKHDLVLISTLFALDELSVFRRLVFKTGVALAGEKIRLNLSTNGFRQLIKNKGYDVKDMLGSREMKEKLLRPHNISLPVLDGFHILTCKI